MVWFQSQLNCDVAHNNYISSPVVGEMKSIVSTQYWGLGGGNSDTVTGGIFKFSTNGLRFEKQVYVYVCVCIYSFFYNAHLTVRKTIKLF